MLYIDSENSFLNYIFKCLIAICKTFIFSISLKKANFSFYPSTVFCISILVIVSVFHSYDWHFISSWDHWVCFRLFILNKAMISSYLYNDVSFVFIVFSLYFVLFFSSVFCGITSYKVLAVQRGWTFWPLYPSLLSLVFPVPEEITIMMPNLVWAPDP